MFSWSPTNALIDPLCRERSFADENEQGVDRFISRELLFYGST